jgi:hypothetical protein
METERFFISYGTDLTIRTPRCHSDKKLYRRMRSILKKLGFSWGMDPDVARNCPLIRYDYNYGRKGDLEFRAEIYPLGCEFRFYQSDNSSKPNTGKYVHDKIRNMSYFVKLELRRCLAKLSANLAKHGYRDDTDKLFKSAREAVEQKRQGHWRHSPVQLNERIDSDGVALTDGDLRYYWHYTGQLRRGHVYHHINNMWFVVVNDSDYDNVAAFDLFSMKPTITRKSVSERRNLNAWQRKLNKAVQEQNFEKAIIFRNLINGTRVPSRRRRKTLVCSGERAGSITATRPDYVYRSATGGSVATGSV